MPKKYNFSPMPLAISISLVFITVLVYAQVVGHEFLYFDDNRYITENPMVQEGLSMEGMIWAFTTMHVSNWHPLTWLSHMLDVELFGLRPGGHHFMNVVIHAANSVLLLILLIRMTGAMWRSAFVAALFALHPLHVESVAWIAERKDVLSGFFGLLTLHAYVSYAASPGWKRYVWVVVLLTLGLLSKPMLVTMPFLLLLLDYWPLGRMRNKFPFIPQSVHKCPPAGLSGLLTEKVPLFALCAASSVMTVVAQKRGEAIADLTLGPGTRLANAAVGYVRYLAKTIWPSSMSVFYPHPGETIPAWQTAGAFVFIVVCTMIVLLRIRKSPWLAVGWLWFIGTLVPVIGLVQVGSQSIADRYTYIPLIGIFIVFAWELPEVFARLRIHPRAVAAAAAVVLITLSGLTWRQTGFWKTHESLFSHALDVTADNWLAHESLGDYFSRRGDAGAALYHTKEALRIYPEDAKAWYNLGVLKRRGGQFLAAVDALQEALRLRPRYVNAWSNLGAAYLSLGRIAEAADALKMASRLSPDNASVWFNLGIIYAGNGQLNGAVDALRKAVKLRPDHAAYWYRLGAVYSSMGRKGEALAVVQRLRSIDAVLAENLLERIGRTPVPEDK